MRLTRAQSKERTRQALLDAAERLFASQGSAASLDEIAEEAGVTTGAVYSNFGSKRVLVAALFERMNNRQLEQIEVAVSPDLNLSQTLSAIAGCWAEPDQDRLITELRTDLQVMLWSLDDPDLAPELQASTVRLNMRITELLTGRVITGHRRTTEADASRLLLHLRALVSYHATATAFRDPLPDLTTLGSDLSRLVEA